MLVVHADELALGVRYVLAIIEGLVARDIKLVLLSSKPW
jgi:hypothetical protein